MNITLTFDGGARPTNPGKGYGSYQFLSDCGKVMGRMERVELGELVTRQITMNWKCRCPHLLALRDEARTRLMKFRHWRAKWHSRLNSVALFGH